MFNATNYSKTNQKTKNVVQCVITYLKSCQIVVKIGVEFFCQFLPIYKILYIQTIVVHLAVYADL